MNPIKTTLWFVGLSFSVGATLVSTWSSSGCSQPGIDCRAARGDFAVHFTKVDGDCADELTFGFVGLESYYPADGDKQNYDKVILAMQSEIVGGLLQESQGYGPEYVDTTHTAYGLGTFTSIEPTEAGVCEVPTFTASEQDIPAIPGEGGGGTGGSGTGGAGGGGAGGAGGDAAGAGGAAGTGGAGGGDAGGAGGAGIGGDGTGGGVDCSEPEPDPFEGLPPRDVKVEFSKARVYVTPAAPGTQFTAEMKYSENIDGATCSATYKLIGIWPPVDCGVYEYDDCDNVVSATPDDSLCQLDPSNAPPGSTVINPDFKATCDPDFLFCVSTKAVSALE